VPKKLCKSDELLSTVGRVVEAVLFLTFKITKIAGSK
jgi:hypothetical protein